MDHTPVTGTSTMRAITQSRYGTSDVLQLTDVPAPRPGEGQVLLRVHAAGLDRGTEHLMTGKPYAVRLAMGVRRPRNPVLGRDVAGTVAETGPGVTRFVPGDEVYDVAPSSFAQYAVADVDKLATKPAALSYAEAAVVRISAGTALQAVRDAATVTSGQSVLITGASGGRRELGRAARRRCGCRGDGAVQPHQARPCHRPGRTARARLRPRRLG